MALVWQSPSGEIQPDTETLGTALEPPETVVPVVDPWSSVGARERAAVEALGVVMEDLVRDRDDLEIYRIRYQRLKHGMQLLDSELIRELAIVAMSVAWSVSDSNGKAELLGRIQNEAH